MTKQPTDPIQDAANLLFDANLDEFATRVSYICALEANGKLTPHQAYEHIKRHWKSLKHSKKNLLDVEPLDESSDQDVDT